MIQTHKLTNAESKLIISLTTGKILSLILKNIVIIEGNDQSILDNGSYLLFPWVNRVTNIKDSPFKDQNGLALHGLYASTQRKIIKSTVNSVELQPTNFDIKYPTFREIYELNNENELIMKVKVENEQNIGYGIGFHPYFRFKCIDEIILKSNLNEQLVVDERLLPIGDKLEWKDVDLKEIHLQNKQFDNTFRQKQKEQVLTQLISKEYSINITSSLPYWQFYTPEDRMSIAIEQQSSTAEQFKYKNYEEQSGVFEVKIQLQ